jgi:hypothetical protein
MTRLRDTRSATKRTHGKHIAVGVSTVESEYAHKLRRSAGWSPKHVADVEGEGRWAS